MVKPPTGTITVLLLLLMLGSSTHVQAISYGASGDAAEAGYTLGKNTVRTYYENLKRTGRTWRTIRDTFLPRALRKALGKNVRRMYSSNVLADVFLPSFLDGYYEEIERYNRLNNLDCIEVEFIKVTTTSFIDACLDELFLTLEVAFDVVTKNPVPPYCPTKGQSCSERLRADFNALYGIERNLSAYDGSLCSSTSSPPRSRRARRATKSSWGFW